MKKIILGIICFISIIILSSFKYYNNDNKQGVNIYLSEHKMNGHFYIVASTCDFQGGISVIHSPNCNCKK